MGSRAWDGRGTTVLMALVLGLALAAATMARPRHSHLEVGFDYARWGQTLENPRVPTDVRRMTRTFREVLKPEQRFYAPKTEGVTFFPNAQRWEDNGSPVTGPKVIPNTPAYRTLWLRWRLFRVPRDAVIQRAELRMAMRLSDRETTVRYPPQVGLALQTVTPDRITLRWNRNFRLPTAPVHRNYPSMWWDVSRFVEVAHQTGELWRNLGLVVDNAGDLTERQPELHVWYTLPVAATAE